MKRAQILIKTLSVLTLVIAMPFLAGGALADELSIGTLKGPTGMGMAQMMTDNPDGYMFTLAAAPDELTGAFISGAIQVAAVPTNLAAVLYAKLDGDVRLMGLNTLGVLYVVSRDGAVASVSDLEGKTVAISGQGALPEYVISFILDANNVSATLEYKSEHSEVSALAAAGNYDVVILPEPHVTALIQKDASFISSLSLTEAFAEAAALKGYDQAVLSMGCVIVRGAYYDAHPEQMARLDELIAASVAFALEHSEQAAAQIGALGIMAEPVALKALPKCNLVWMTGADMKSQVQPLFEILYAANPASVGGALPDDLFYAKQTP